jgi:hypothetical protein
MAKRAVICEILRQGKATWLIDKQSRHGTRLALVFVLGFSPRFQPKH